MRLFACPEKLWTPIVALALVGCFDPSEPQGGSETEQGSTSMPTSAGPSSDPSTDPTTSPSTSGPSTTVDPSNSGSTLDPTDPTTSPTDPSTTSVDSSSSSGEGDTSSSTTEDEGSSSTGPMGVVLFEDTFERPNSPDLGDSEHPAEEWTETTIIGPGEMSILDGALVGRGNGITGHDEDTDCATLRLRAVARMGTVGSQESERLLIKYDQNGVSTGGGYGIAIDTSTGEGGDHIGIQPGHIGLPPPTPLAQTPANGVLDAGVDYYLELITTGTDAVLTVREGSYNGTIIANVSTGEAPAPGGNLNNVLIRMDRPDGAPGITAVGEVLLSCEE